MRTPVLSLWILLVFKASISTSSSSTTSDDGDANVCHSNICDDKSLGLKCPSGSFVHILRMSCSDGSSPCSWNSYASLYGLCEGSNHCDASGLKLLFPQYCDVDDVSRRNVFVQYLCVPGNKVFNPCPTRLPKRLNVDFGVLKRPKLKTPTKGSFQCRWTVLPQDENTEVELIIYMAQKKLTNRKCDPGLLDIRYVDCRTGVQDQRSFCNIREFNVTLRSCGIVKITSNLNAEDLHFDYFVLTFERNPSTRPSLASCVPVPKEDLKVIAPATVLPPEGTTSRPGKGTKVGDASNAASGARMDEYGDSDSGLSFKLKLLILYVILGLVILTLLVALIVVIVRYRNLSKPKKAKKDDSEKTVLWKQQPDDTHMKTFQNNSMAETSGHLVAAPANGTNGVKRPRVHSDHENSKAHSDQACADLDNRISSGSGISSFLSGNRDSGFKDLISKFQSASLSQYSHVNENAEDMTEMSSYALPDQGRGSDIYEAVDPEHRNSRGQIHPLPNGSLRSNYDDQHHHLVTSQEQQPLVAPKRSPCDELHYCVNNDEYAVVRKSKKPPKPPGNTHNELGRQMSLDNTTDSYTVDFCPTSGPYDKKRNSSSSDHKRWSKGGSRKFE